MPESAATIAITTVLAILVIFDIVGNSLVCAIIKRNGDMRYKETEKTKTLITFQAITFRKDLRRNPPGLPVLF